MVFHLKNLKLIKLKSTRLIDKYMTGGSGLGVHAIREHYIPVTPGNAGFSKSRSVHIRGLKLPHPAHAPYLRPVGKASASCSRPLPTSCRQKYSISYSKSSFQNKEDGRLLACPSGASVENQSFVVALENDQSLSTSDVLTWIPTEALKSRFSRYHGYYTR